MGLLPLLWAWCVQPGQSSTSCDASTPRCLITSDCSDPVIAFATGWSRVSLLFLEAQDCQCGLRRCAGHWEHPYSPSTKSCVQDHQLLRDCSTYSCMGFLLVVFTISKSGRSGSGKRETMISGFLFQWHFLFLLKVGRKWLRSMRNRFRGKGTGFGDMKKSKFTRFLF